MEQDGASVNLEERLTAMKVLVKIREYGKIISFDGPYEYKGGLGLVSEAYLDRLRRSQLWVVVATRGSFQAYILENELVLLMPTYW